ncbi:iron-containing alcohol dehydrogenase [Haloferax denitrificans]|uniref:iron-containing alcohol dehydrogenase n=1 Tax=Haloferax denitrificans TaxID=35745 RepID=UPI0019554332
MRRVPQFLTASKDTLIGSNLRQAVHQGAANDQARYDMCFAATLAGQAFVNSGLGAVHALTYPLVVEHGIGHGFKCGTPPSRYGV